MDFWQDTWENCKNVSWNNRFKHTDHASLQSLLQGLLGKQVHPNGGNQGKVPNSEP